MTPAEPRYYQRFSLGQRYLHGVLAATFLGLSFTGLELRFSSTAWVQAISGATGGFGAILFFHKFCAVILSAAFIAHVANIVYRVAVKREFGLVWGPNSLVPRKKDFLDFYANIKWFLHLGPKPQFDRYAYWDKVDYWAVFWGMGIIGFSGYAMWFASWFGRFIPGSWLNVALVVHGEEAILAVGFIFTIHFFNTHLRPENFPMDLTIFTGRQSADHFKRAHPEEYARLAENGQLESIAADPPPQWLRNFALVVGSAAVFAGLLMLVFLAVAFLR